MTGGNAVMKVMAHSISQPPLSSFHFTATGLRRLNMLSLKTRKRIARTKVTMPAKATSALCKGDNFSMVR